MKIFSSLHKHIVISVLISLAAIIIAIIAGKAATQKPPVANISTGKQVTLVNAATFRKGNLTISADGVVTANSQVDLKSQTSAPISIINVSIGQSVSAGQVIMELQNSDTRAQLAQAQASLALAQGQYQTGVVTQSSATQNAVDKIRDAYNKTNDAVTQAEQILYNNNGRGGRLTSYTSDNVIYNEILFSDLDLKTGLLDWKNAVNGLATSSDLNKIEVVIKLSQKNMATANLLFNDMSKIVNDLTINATADFLPQVNGWKSSITGSQSSVSGVGQALTAAEMTLNTSVSSQGGTAQAQVALAQAGVNNLQAQLEKTIIRSPISGKISALPLRESELASPGTLLATVIGNEGGLKIKAYVSGDDLSRIKINNQATISQNQVQQSGSSTQNIISGIVSNISPSVDPTTKKAEVDIVVQNSYLSKLVIGQNVSVSITPFNSITPADASVQTYLLPIQDIKIIPGAAFVYTVDVDSKIKRNDVIIGQIQGDFIEVTSGLTDSMNIISPVYELDEGEKVVVR